MTAFLKWPAATIAQVLVAGAVVASPSVTAETPRVAMLDVAHVASVATLLVDGTYGFGFEGNMDDKVQGAHCRPPYECTEVDYNNWVFAPVSAGVKALDAAVVSTHGKKLIFAYSRGALATLEWIDDNPKLASDGEKAYVFIGNPARKYGGSQAEKSQDYNTAGVHIIDISTEYDSVSDVYDKRRGTWFGRMLARSNNKFSQHLSYDEVDLTREDLLVYTETNETGGTITYVLVPEENLPILNGLRVWMPKLAAKIQEQWKPLIDATYDRSMFEPAGPGGVKLPFADEGSTMVEMTDDESVSVLSSELVPARTAKQDTVQPSEPEEVSEPVVDDSEPVQIQVNASLDLDESASNELVQDDTEQDQDAGSELELEPETESEFESELETELEADQELNPLNEEEESDLERELESELEEESEEQPEKLDEDSGKRSLNSLSEGDGDEKENDSSVNDDERDSPDPSDDE